jgi:solute carrier family 25 (mitochondrial iron transporter), member 28/37
MGAEILLASAFAGALSRFVVHPLDTVRARLMVARGRAGGVRGVLEAARAVVSTDGVRGLYRGFGLSVVVQAPAVAVYLSTYERAKPAVVAAMPHLNERHPVVHLAAALAAEGLSGVLWVPMEVVKQRAQVRAGSAAAATSAAVVRDLLTHEGPRALYRGYGLTLAVFGPYSMLYFVSYERFKDMWARGLGVNMADLPLQAVAASAACSGALAGAATCPLDIVKTRLQTQGDVAARTQVRSTVAGAATGSAVVYRGAWHAIQTIAQQEGWRGFLRGVTARVVWLMPATAITMSTFEHLKRTYIHPREA